MVVVTEFCPRLAVLDDDCAAGLEAKFGGSHSQDLKHLCPGQWLIRVQVKMSDAVFGTMVASVSDHVGKVQFAALEQVDLLVLPTPQDMIGHSLMAADRSDAATAEYHHSPPPMPP